MKTNVQNPTSWLVAQLPGLLTPAAHLALMTAYREQQIAYGLSRKIITCQREIAHFARMVELHGEHSDQGKRYAKRLEQRRQKLDELDAEQVTQLEAGAVA